MERKGWRKGEERDEKHGVRGDMTSEKLPPHTHTLPPSPSLVLTLTQASAVLGGVHGPRHTGKAATGPRGEAGRGEREKTHEARASTPPPPRHDATPGAGGQTGQADDLENLLDYYFLFSSLLPSSPPLPLFFSLVCAFDVLLRPLFPH